MVIYYKPQRPERRKRLCIKGPSRVHSRGTTEQYSRSNGRGTDGLPCSHESCAEEAALFRSHDNAAKDRNWVPAFCFWTTSSQRLWCGRSSVRDAAFGHVISCICLATRLRFHHWPCGGVPKEVPTMRTRRKNENRSDLVVDRGTHWAGTPKALSARRHVVRFARGQARCIGMTNKRTTVKTTAVHNKNC
jgi:hypothetical protein